MLIEVSTVVLPSSGQVTFTSTVSPTDFDLTLRNKYSISKVGSFDTSTFFVSKQSLIISTMASVICF